MVVPCQYHRLVPGSSFSCLPRTWYLTRVARWVLLEARPIIRFMFGQTNQCQSPKHEILAAGVYIGGICPQTNRHRSPSPHFFLFFFTLLCYYIRTPFKMLDAKVLIAFAAAIQPLALAATSAWGQCESTLLGYQDYCTDSSRWR